MKNRRQLFLIFILTFAGPSYASDDFGLWFEAGITKKLNPKGLSVSTDLGLRTKNNSRDIDRWSWSLGMDYKLNPYLKVEVGYMYLNYYNPTEVYYTYQTDDNGNTIPGPDGNPKKKNKKTVSSYSRSKNRYLAALTGYAYAGRFTFSLRERYQLTYQGKKTVDRVKQVVNYDASGAEVLGEVVDDPDLKDAKTKHYLRSRFLVEYNIAKCPFTPYASVELSNNLAGGFKTDKTRLALGGEYKIQKKHQISLSYYYQIGHDDDSEDNSHIIDLSYNYKF